MLVKPRGPCYGNDEAIFLRLLEQGDTEEEQEAIEAAVINNWMHMSYQLKEDQRRIEEQKPEILDWFRAGAGREVTPRPQKRMAKKRAKSEVTKRKTAASSRRAAVNPEKTEARSKRIRS